MDRVYVTLAELLIELKLNEEQDKITQIVTSTSGAVKHSMYDEYVNASKGKVPSKGKAKEEMAKVASRTGVHLATNSGNQMVAHKDINVPSIIQGDSQADVQSAALPATTVTTPLNAHIQSNPKPRMRSGMILHASRMKSIGRSLHGRLMNTKLLRARKAKVRGPSLRVGL